jgi:hypothetical protein
MLLPEDLLLGSMRSGEGPGIVLKPGVNFSIVLSYFSM